MSKILLFSLISLWLSACNSVYFKPNTIETHQTFYADRGGYAMQRSVKERLEKKGYNVQVGKAIDSKNFVTDNANIEIDTSTIPNDVRYIIKVSERKEWFNIFWCPFNGFWWWNFNVSIADQKTGEEIMTWRGRGCQNSSLRMFDDIIDKMEIKVNEQNN